MRGQPLDEIEIASLADVGWWISWGHSLNTDVVRTPEQFEAIVSSLPDVARWIAWRRSREQKRGRRPGGWRRG
jgi:hypothetical protein